jgi:AhpD family alkylhydroperoxidase
MAEMNYPEKYIRLQKLAGRLGKQIPEPMKGFRELHQNSLADGQLPRKTKELIALGIAISALCEGCVAYHVHDALKAGASREEVLETIGVALMMGGGPALIYGCEAFEALEQFEGEVKASSAA